METRRPEDTKTCRQENSDLEEAKDFNETEEDGLKNNKLILIFWIGAVSWPAFIFLYLGFNSTDNTRTVLFLLAAIFFMLLSQYLMFKLRKTKKP